MAKILTKNDLPNIIVEALRGMPNNEAYIIEIAKYIWKKHQKDLENSGSLLFTWQYDMRWAGKNLNTKGKMNYKKGKDNRNLWVLT